MNEDIIRGVFASLSAQRQNIPEGDPIKAVYVDNFHEQLDLLEKTGVDTSRFRVPDNQVSPLKINAGVTHFGERPSIRYTSERYVDRSILLTRIDTVLGYFTLGEEKASMGFHP